MVKLFSKNSNLCDHNSPTSQTDRQTTCDRNTALCTKVHRAVKINWKNETTVKVKQTVIESLSNTIQQPSEVFVVVTLQLQWYPWIYPWIYGYPYPRQPWKSPPTGASNAGDWYNKKPSCRYDSRPYCLTAPSGSRDVIGHVTIW